jgi:hypothetical protein
MVFVPNTSTTNNWDDHQESILSPVLGYIEYRMTIVFVVVNQPQQLP